MDLKIKGQNFLVCGATSGFGLAVAKALLDEDANIIAIARSMDKLQDLKNAAPSRVEILQADLSEPETMDKISKILEKLQLSGAFVNSGGPPAMTFMETRLENWDDSYRQLLRWKVDLTQLLVKNMKQQSYGRIVYLESVSVKQPVENLVLSNSLRMAVTGMMKTLANEISSSGINLNLLAPGYHDTPAINRLIENKSRKEGISPQEAKESMISKIPLKQLGKAEDLAGLAVWLLSPLSVYITGQVFSVDGGIVKHVFG